MAFEEFLVLEVLLNLLPAAAALAVLAFSYTWYRRKK